MTPGMTEPSLALGDHTDRRATMWISKQRILAMEANINRCVYVLQQQQQVLEELGLAQTRAIDSIKSINEIAEMKAKKAKNSGSEAQNGQKLRK